MIVKLLAEHHLEFLSLKRGCTGLSKSTRVKMAHCWKSHALAQIINITNFEKYRIFLEHLKNNIHRKYNFVTSLCPGRGGGGGGGGGGVL